MIRRRSVLVLTAGFLTFAILPGSGLCKSSAGSGPVTATPIEHLVVIFQENVSFDHYFATYPNATNPSGEPAFTAASDTPTVNGLSGILLTSNPNSLNTANNTGAVNPFRLDLSQAATADQDHDYTPEQMAFDHGLMDLFPMSVGTAGPPPTTSGPVSTTGLTMGYYDGNTVTAIWNYAQHFAMSDNSYGTVFGPSTVGALNLASGQTNGVTMDLNAGDATIDGGGGSLTVVGDADPVGDACSTTTGEMLQMGGQNVGDLLTAANITWGFFEGGFDLTVTNSNGTTACQRSTTSAVTNVKKVDYIPHHQPFQYYPSTANATHTRPTSIADIGANADAANHQYDSHDFFDALKAKNMPSVVFLKAPGFQDGHAGYSDPTDEQTWLVNTINTIEASKFWKTTAIVIAYDDSDGWYDHQMSPIVNQSASAADALTDTGACGSGSAALQGYQSSIAHAQGRCGYGPRLPLLAISPYAKVNFVDHTATNQASVLRFIEDNWLSGARIAGSFDAVSNSISTLFDFSTKTLDKTLVLDPTTGNLPKKK